jgi:hypothetical protein
MKVCLWLVIALSLIASVAAYVGPPEVVLKVQSGEFELTCLFEDGWREVPKNKVIGLDGLQWLFTNGAASACRVEKR